MGYVCRAYQSTEVWDFETCGLVFAGRWRRGVPVSKIIRFHLITCGPDVPQYYRLEP